MENTKPVVNLYNSDYFTCLSEAVEKCLTSYCAKAENQDLNNFKDKLLKDLDQFAHGKEMSDDYSFSLAVRYDNEMKYISFYAEPQLIEVSCGGSIYTEYVGSDSFTDWMYSVWIDGTEDYNSFEMNPLSFEEFINLAREDRVHFIIELPEDAFFDSENIDENEDEN